MAPSASLRMGNGRPKRNAISRWYSVVWPLRPNSRVPVFEIGLKTSRNPSSSGVEPWAPGMSSHSGGLGAPGLPVQG